MMSQPKSRTPDKYAGARTAITVVLFVVGSAVMGGVILSLGSGDSAFMWDAFVAFVELIKMLVIALLFGAGIFALAFWFLPLLKKGAVTVTPRTIRLAREESPQRKADPPLLNLGPNRKVRADQITQADLTQLYKQGQDSANTNWRNLSAKMEARIAELEAREPEVVEIEVEKIVYKATASTAMPMALSDEFIRAWLYNVTPDGGRSYPFRAKRNQDAMLKSMRANSVAIYQLGIGEDGGVQIIENTASTASPTGTVTGGVANYSGGEEQDHQHGASTDEYDPSTESVPTASTVPARSDDGEEDESSGTEGVENTPDYGSRGISPAFSLLPASEDSEPTRTDTDD